MFSSSPDQGRSCNIQGIFIFYHHLLPCPLTWHTHSLLCVYIREEDKAKHGATDAPHNALSDSREIPHNHGERVFSPSTLPPCVTPGNPLCGSWVHWLAPLVHKVFWGISFGSFPYCPHAHILQKLTFCASFPCLQTALPVSCSTKKSPVMLCGHPAGLGWGVEAFQLG